MTDYYNCRECRTEFGADAINEPKTWHFCPYCGAPLRLVPIQEEVN